jgi:hypothetical protein
MQIDPTLESRALQQAFQKYPRFEAYHPRIIARALFQGHAFMVQYTDPPPPNDPDAWEFQNTAVKAYKRLAGL